MFEDGDQTNITVLRLTRCCIMPADLRHVLSLCKSLKEFVCSCELTITYPLTERRYFNAMWYVLHINKGTLERLSLTFPERHCPGLQDLEQPRPVRSRFLFGSFKAFSKLKHLDVPFHALVGGPPYSGPSDKSTTNYITSLLPTTLETLILRRCAVKGRHIRDTLHALCGGDAFARLPRKSEFAHLQSVEVHQVRSRRRICDANDLMVDALQRRHVELKLVNVVLVPESISNVHDWDGNLKRPRGDWEEK